MNPLLLRLAFSLAWSRDARHRWRQLCVVTGAAVAVLLIALSSGIVMFSHRAELRRAARVPVTAASAEQAQLAIVPLGEIWQQRQFPVVWLEPRGAGGLLPPGLRELPAPGRFVVSPGLFHSGAARGLGMELSRTGTGPDGTIGFDGLGTPSEWYAYARPPTGRGLGDGRHVLYVRAFGAGQLERILETEDPTPSVTIARLGSAWMILLPGAILAAGCAATLSLVRRARCHTLYKLGLTPGQLHVLGAVETGCLAAVGALGGALTWWWVGPRVVELPLAHLTIPNHELSVPGHLLAVIVALVTVVMALLGTASIRMSSPARATARQGATPHRVSGLRALPLLTAVALMLGGRVASPRVALPLLSASLIVVVASLPWTIPWLVRLLGSVFARSRQPARWLAGERLVFSPTALARPAVAIGVLVFIAGAAGGVSRQITEVSAYSGKMENAFRLGWRDAGPTDIATLRRDLPAAVVADFRMTAEASESVYFASCADVARALAIPADRACDQSGRVTKLAATEIRRFFVPVNSPVPVDFHAAAGTPAPLPAGDYGQAIVFGTGEADLAPAIWAATNSKFAGVNLSRLSAESIAPSRQRDWLVGGAALAAFVLLLAALQAYGNRVLALAHTTSAWPGWPWTKKSWPPYNAGHS